MENVSEEFVKIQFIDYRVSVSKSFLETRCEHLNELIASYSLSSSPLHLQCTMLSFQEFINYLKTHQLHLTSTGTSLEIYKLGKDFKIEDILPICRNYILQQINNQNVCFIYEFACENGDEIIQFRCWQHFDVFCDEILDSESFLLCKEITVLRFVSRPIYAILREEKLFFALLRWVERRELEEQSRNSSAKSTEVTRLQRIRARMEPFLRMIRFLSVDINILESSVFKKNILTEEEMTAIRSSFFPPEYELPPTICKNPNPRRNTNPDSLIHYVNKRFVHAEKRIKFTKSQTFQCEFYAEEDSFLINFVLPITHEMPNRIPVVTDVIFSGREVNLMDDTTKCSQTGNIELENPIFIPKQSSVIIFVKIGNTELSNSEIFVKSEFYYVTDTEWREFESSNAKGQENPFKIHYLSVLLYF
ncbi:uncharacterized protein LOC111633356 [Centruroides sculpturatus]|uniref:uncharacterized protein LOC111633356 n=1 Tax=Centruroides sculpturatus TaxID=218467 RepID=UPI000C6D6378|nr:uncharacterized protein LOC111633356 [Centruroides sculpturatus]